MRALILVSHGDFSKELKRSVEMIAGETPNIKTVGLSPEEGPENLQARFDEISQEFDKYQDIIVFTDLYGGSPGKEAVTSLFEYENVSFISGMNFPMILTAVLDQEISVQDLIEVGRTGIINIRESLSFDDEDE